MQVTRYSGWMIDSDPTLMSRVIVSTVLNFNGKGYFPTITSLRDDGSSLYIDQNYFIIP